VRVTPSLVFLVVAGCTSTDSDGETLPYLAPEEFWGRYAPAYCELLASCAGDDLDECLDRFASETDVGPCYSGTFAYECVIWVEDAVDRGACPVSNLRACANYDWWEGGEDCTVDAADRE
jgi:hypothetical protein